MSLLRISKLGEKEVINLCDGARLGCVSDVLIDSSTGRLCALLIPAKKEGLFAPNCEYEVPWCDIERIGSDYIFLRTLAPPRPVPKKGLFG